MGYGFEKALPRRLGSFNTRSDVYASTWGRFLIFTAATPYSIRGFYR